MSNGENPTPSETTATESCAACGGLTSGLPFCRRGGPPHRARAMVLGHALHPQLSSVVRISVDPEKIGHRIADIGPGGVESNVQEHNWPAEALRAYDLCDDAGAVRLTVTGLETARRDAPGCACDPDSTVCSDLCTAPLHVLAHVSPSATPRRSGSTRRERLEAKLEKRQEWAEGRREKAAGLEKSVEKYHGDYAFNTQPGHIPERARVIRRQDKAIEHSQMADHHEERAAGLERQLDKTIFSDDPDAIEALAARIATLEAEAERKTAWNRTWKAGAAVAEKLAKKAGKAGEDLLIARLDGGEEALRAADVPRNIILAANSAMEPGYSWVKAPFDLTHLRAEIRRNRARIEEVKRGQERQAEVNAAPGGLVITRHEGAGLAVVRFAEKPDQEVLDALRAAEYRFGAGAWVGKLDRLPAVVLELEAAGR